MSTLVEEKAVVSPAPISPKSEGKSTAPRLHLAYIDGLRALAALYVVCVHLLPRAWENQQPIGLLKLVAKVLAQGHFAVTAFIVISGFCLMLPVIRADNTLRGGISVFFKRRFWRIAPPFYIAFAFSALLLQAGSGSGVVPPYYQDTAITTKHVLGHLLLLQYFVPGATLPNNGVFWSINVEWLIYLWFPLLVLLWRRIGPIKATLAAVGWSYVLFALVRGTLLEPMTAQYLGAFAIGAWATDVCFSPTARWHVLRERIPWFAVAVGLFVLVASPIVALGWERMQTFVPVFDLLIAFATACVLIGASRDGKNPVRNFLSLKPLVWVGTFSFSLYMVHFPLADVLCYYVVLPLHLPQYMTEACIVFGVIPILIGFSYMFFLAFERPFHALAKRVS